MKRDIYFLFLFFLKVCYVFWWSMLKSHKSSFFNFHKVIFSQKNNFSSFWTKINWTLVRKKNNILTVIDLIPISACIQDSQIGNLLRFPIPLHAIQGISNAYNVLVGALNNGDHKCWTTFSWNIRGTVNSMIKADISRC